jgi:SAM-dependent methyltransferase
MIRTMTEAPAANPWAEGWDAGDRAQRWVAIEEAMDRALGPFGEAALARARPQPGERVIDVGCGCGATVVALAQAVGPRGRVLGVDIAAPILDRARARTAGLSQVELLQADAQTFAFSSDHDLVFSRYGVMFFQDERAAFANLGRALRPGGRLTFVTWRAFEENAWMTLPFAELRKILPDAPGPPPAGPSPFAFADPQRTRRLLEGAGFRDVELDRLDAPVNLGPDLPSAVRIAMNTGPTGRALPGTDQATRDRVREQLAVLLGPSLGADGIALPGSAWVVHARRG